MKLLPSALEMATKEKKERNYCWCRLKKGRNAGEQGRCEEGGIEEGGRERKQTTRQETNASSIKQKCSVNSRNQKKNNIQKKSTTTKKLTQLK